MITRTQSFQTTDGKIHATIEEAQQHEIAAFLLSDGILESGPSGLGAEEVAACLVKHKERFADYLTMKANSRPKARKANGAVRKPRTAKPETQPAA